MLRGRDALSVEDNGDHLVASAKLADGAQLGRNDLWVFRRQATLRRKQDGSHYRIAVKVLYDLDPESFPPMARSAKLNGVLDGFRITVEDGVLRVVTPITPDCIKAWTHARQGDTVYRVVHFTLPKYRRLGSDSDGKTPVEICVSRWVPEGATELPSWVLKVP